MEPTKDVERLFKLADHLMLAAVVGIAGYATKELGRIQDSIALLNTQIAVVVERINYHDKQIQAQRLELDRLSKQRR